MESILLFLVNSISGGAIGHYISKGLGKIDSELPALLKNKPDIRKLEKVVSEKGLNQDIMKFAKKVKSKIDNKGAVNVLNFTGGFNEGIVANNLEIRPTNKTIKIAAPLGTIASSLIHRNYSKYLIDRYHDFKVADVGKENMKYSVFYSVIKRKFGAKWDMIPLGKFADLSFFIQQKIDNTILGKNKKTKHIKSYSTFEEYSDKHGN